MFLYFEGENRGVDWGGMHDGPLRISHMRPHALAVAVALAAGTTLPGCATSYSSSAPDAVAGQDAHAQTSLDYPWYARKRWGNDGAGVAAARGPDYIHVLTRDRRLIDGAWADLRPTPEASDQTSASAQPPETRPSLPAAGALARNDMDNRLRRAWRRFCDGGHEMTADDWNAIAEAGGLAAMPPEFEADCRPPK
jgi:hypothetical protein